MKKAVLWDFGGVILSSPFEAFNRYEADHGLPPDFIRSVNATNPHDNAWAKLERGEISPRDFDQAFADESAALGNRVPMYWHCCPARFDRKWSHCWIA